MAEIVLLARYRYETYSTLLLTHKTSKWHSLFLETGILNYHQKINETLYISRLKIMEILPNII